MSALAGVTAAITIPALTSAVLPNNSLCCMIPFSTRTRKGVFLLKGELLTRSPP